MVGGTIMTRHARAQGHAAKPGSPTPNAIARLIDRAGRHPLGVTFLRDGSLDAVAATFGVHAFTIEAARARLTGPPDISPATPRRAETRA